MPNYAKADLVKRKNSVTCGIEVKINPTSQEVPSPNANMSEMQYDWVAFSLRVPVRFGKVKP
jgi:hypothetical protein